MKLFKNRGDIYLSKSKTKGSKQAKILYSLLAFIVIFTVVFVVLLNQRYPTVADFFAQGEITEQENTAVYDDVLPVIEGKTNFLIMETNDSEDVIHYLFLVQADKDNLAYKVSPLPVDMMIDDSSVSEIFAVGGSPAVQTKLSEYFGFEIDYQAQFKTSSFVEFINKLGSFIYTSNSEIKFSGGEEDDKYSFHIQQGEQKLSGRDINNLIRYYSEEEKNYAAQSQLILSALTGLFNEENYENSEALFRLFVKSCNTDITVRDFENGKTALMVFCTKNTDITVYSAVTEAQDGVITQNSVKEIKGYFSKQ